VVGALKHWRHYLQGAVSLTIVTDHRPNVTFDTKKPEHLSGRQIRWGQFMSKFNCQWEWRKGVANVAAPLSRNPAFLAVVHSSVLGTPSEEVLELLRQGSSHDPYFEDMRKLRALRFDGKFWRRHSAIVVPDFEGLRQKVISLYHDAPYSGHLGRDRTLNLVVRHFWWPTVYKDVAPYVGNCDLCQRTKGSTQAKSGLVQPLGIPKRAWESTSMDLITQLPPTGKGHTAIIVFVDRLTKMVHIVPTVTSVGAREFAQIYMTHVFANHGLPKNFRQRSTFHFRFLS